MDLIDQVSEIQAGYRDLLVTASKQKDPLLEEEALYGSIERYGKEAIVNFTTVWVLAAVGKVEPTIGHLVMTVKMMDHLDSIGMVLRFKSET